MYDQIAENRNKTIILFIVFLVLALGMGYAFGWMFFDFPFIGLTFAGILCIFWGIISYFASDKIIFAITGAKEVQKQDYPYLFNLVEGLAIAAGIQKPRCYVINDPALNAFATGRDPVHAAIVVTTGIMKALNRQELEGVIAHEMSHIKNRDILVMSFSAVLVGIVMIIADIALRMTLFSRSDRDNKNPMLFAVGILFLILSPIIAQLIKFAISREREYLADASGALLTRYPEGLASALEKISSDKNQLRSASNSTAHLFISNPFKQKNFLTGIFSTHPPIEDRIKRLRMM